MGIVKQVTTFNKLGKIIAAGNRRKSVRDRVFGGRETKVVPLLPDYADQTAIAKDSSTFDRESKLEPHVDTSKQVESDSG